MAKENDFSPLVVDLVCSLHVFFLPGDFSGSRPKTSVNLILNLNDLD